VEGLRVMYTQHTRTYHRLPATALGNGPRPTYCSAGTESAKI